MSVSIKPGLNCSSYKTHDEKTGTFMPVTSALQTVQLNMKAGSCTYGTAVLKVRVTLTLCHSESDNVILNHLSK